MTEPWKIKYDNDTGPSDEGYWEWWTITNGDKSFRCNRKSEAEWLCYLLNKLASYAPSTALPAPKNNERD